MCNKLIGKAIVICEFMFYASIRWVCQFECLALYAARFRVREV